MLKASSVFVSLCFVFFSGAALESSSLASDVQEATRASSTDASGRWIVNADVYGTPIFFQMHLKEEAGKLTGDFSGDKLEGTITGNAIHFVAKDERGARKSARQH